MLTAPGTCVAASGSLRALQNIFPFVNSMSGSHTATSNVPALSGSETVAAPTYATTADGRHKPMRGHDGFPGLSGLVLLMCVLTLIFPWAGSSREREK